MKHGGLNGKMNVFDKIKVLQEQVNSVFPEMSFEELKLNVGYLANFWHGKKRKNVTLSKEQLTIYEVLLKNDYNPATVYRWLLLATGPNEIKDKVRTGELSIRQALKFRREHKELVSTSEQEFIQAIIGCIENFVSEAGENYPGRVVNGKR